MKYVLTLIGNKSTPLRDEHLSAMDLPARAVPDWLAPGMACDIAFESDAADTVEGALRSRFADSGLDLVVQQAAGRKRKLLVADMDSTIIQQECIDELAAELGIKPQIAAITERAMRGEIKFEPALRERVGLLKGLPLAALEKVYAERIIETPGGRALTATMRKHGGTCALVSGGFTFFTERVAKAVGFDVNQANELFFDGDRLSGKVAEPILGREAKVEALVRLRGELNLKAHDTIAVGDGANDLGMLDEAGIGIAFHAKPVVAEAADARIDHGDLTALLYLQGYRENEIVTR